MDGVQRSQYRSLPFLRQALRVECPYVAAYCAEATQAKKAMEGKLKSQVEEPRILNRPLTFDL
jgi:hypothetical protein